MFVSVGGPTGPAGAGGATGATGAAGATGPQGAAGPYEFVDRGDPNTWDFATAAFTKDGLWYDLDLSAIVPAGAVAVLLRLVVKNTVLAKSAYFRKNGNVNIYNVAAITTQVNNCLLSSDIWVSCDANRKIEYALDVATWSLFYVTVAGWVV